VLDKECRENTALKEIKRQKIENMSIGIEREVLDQYHGNYPTILLSFRTNKASNIESFKLSIAYKIQKLFKKHLYLAQSTKLSFKDKQEFNRYMNRHSALTDEDLKNSVRFLSDMLNKHFDMPVIILFNKYDDYMKAYSMELISHNAPVVSSDFSKEGSRLIGGIIFRALDKNPHLLRSLIFGTTKVRDMEFFKIKNIVEDSILEPRFGDYFGFTNKELDLLLDEYKVKNLNQDTLARIKRYYGGYSLNGMAIYNPAGIMRMLGKYKALHRIDFTHIRYISLALDLSSKKRRNIFEKLINGGRLNVEIDPNISYIDTNSSIDNLCSILAFEGFLAISKAEKLPNGKYRSVVKIPNEEMRLRFKSLLKHFPSK